MRRGLHVTFFAGFIVFGFTFFAIVREYSAQAQQSAEEGTLNQSAKDVPHIPIPQVSPTSNTTIQKSCSLYSLDFQATYLGQKDNLLEGGSGAFTQDGHPDLPTVRSDTTELSCLKQLFEDAAEAADLYIAGLGDKNQPNDWRGTRSAKFWDDRFIRYISWGQQSAQVLNFTDDCDESGKFTDAELGWTANVDPNSGRRLTSCKQVTTYFDENCQRVSDPDTTKLCGSTALFLYLSSPISLVWENGSQVGESVSIVRFPLNPSEKGSSWIWKASGRHPLLVYDPTHQGKITSATQLFGNWTFGGQRVASLSLSDGALPRPWRDGYEALATLDLDGDGVIAGTELAPLGLWFDDNMDGRSQAGEVQSATKAGVRELYYSNAVKNPLTQDVELKVGFKRIDEHGREHTGASVDWYSDRADNPGELFVRHLKVQDSNGRNGAAGSLTEETSVAARKPSRKDRAASKAADLNVTGVWDWSFDAADLAGGKQVGFLFLETGENGAIRGRTVIEAPVVGNVGIKSMIHTAVLRGQVSRGGSMTFVTETGQGVIKNTAIVSGSTIDGESVYTSAKGTKSIRYKWVAKKRDIRAFSKKK